MSHLVGDLKYLLNIRVQKSWRAIFRPATECVIVAVGRNDFRSIGLLGVFGQCLFCASGCLLQVQELAFDLVGSAIP